MLWGKYVVEKVFEGWLVLNIECSVKAAGKAPFK